MGTFSKMLIKVKSHHMVAYQNSKAEILKRNNLTEEQIDGIRWHLEEELDTRQDNDMIQFRLYKLEDASTTYVESQVRSKVEDGIENMPQIKNKKEAYDRAGFTEKN